MNDAYEEYMRDKRKEYYEKNKYKISYLRLKKVLKENRKQMKELIKELTELKIRKRKYRRLQRI